MESCFHQIETKDAEAPNFLRNSGLGFVIFQGLPLAWIVIVHFLFS